MAYLRPHPPIRMHKALWLIPPFVGVVFYVAGSTRVAHGLPAAPASDFRSRVSATGHSLLPAVAGLSAHEIQSAARTLAAADYRQLGNRSPAELKSLIVKIVGIFRDRGRGNRESDPELDPILDAAVIALARQEKGAGWEWMSARAPEWARLYISGWVESEPAAAFEAVAHSPLAKPCSREDLMTMLQSFAKRSPALLREACLRAPWQAFSGEASTSPPPALTLPEGGSVRPWIESGVLPELRDRGVDVSAAFRIWISESPAEALAAWSCGNGPYADEQESITSLLNPASLREPERTAALTAIDSMSPEDQRRISMLMSRYVRENSFAKDWAEIYPGLIRNGKSGGEGQR